jgi:DNA-binding NarL/FixJ family response regulator
MFTMKPDNRMRVRVQHADAVVSAGLNFALQQQTDLVICDCADQDAEIAICDYESGLELARLSLESDFRPIRVLVLTDMNKEQSVTRALQSGVQGYLLSSAGLEELITAVRAIMQGQRYLSPQVAQRMADSLTHESLTPRETGVLELLAAGQCNKDVARRLGIATGTVKAHVKAIMSKLQATSRTHAVSIAALRGMVAFERSTVH